MAQQRILCVAYGQAVKERRCHELMAAGYSVIGTTTVMHAAPLLVSNEFDLVIVGVQFTDEEASSGESVGNWRAQPCS